MPQGLISKKHLIDIASAIRAKTGSNELYTLTQIPDAILSIDGTYSGEFTHSEDTGIGLVTDIYLSNIADAIREKLGDSSAYTPDLMADAILTINGDPLPAFNVIKESKFIMFRSQNVDTVNNRTNTRTQTESAYGLSFVQDSSDAGYHVYNNQGSNTCSMFNIAVPKEYNYLCFDIESTGRSGQYNLLTLYIRDAFGVTGQLGGNFAGNNLKTVSFCNYGATVEDINNQQGVTINTSNIYQLGRQTVIVDVSDIDTDMYLGFHQCDNRATIYSIIAAQRLGHSNI